MPGAWSGMITPSKLCLRRSAMIPPHVEVARFAPFAVPHAHRLISACCFTAALEVIHQMHDKVGGAALDGET